MSDAPDEQPEVPPPLELRDPLPPVVDDEASLSATVDLVAQGTGPVALDAERASGYRYSARAYLVQLRRVGAGTALIDPTAFDDLRPLDAAIGDAEWILHAATQDLPCLADIGLVPARLFDTELAGRLLNLSRVGLAYLVQEVLGRSLAKEHSAVDWSTRPLPEPWLLYAALDVEALVELRDDLDARLVEAGKRDWAQQEFDALLSFTGPRRKPDPWRRTSGIHKVRNRAALGLVRELWQCRDRIAAQRDVASGRVLPDAAIIEIATTRPKDRATLRNLPTMRKRGARRHLEDWYEAVQSARALTDEDLPPLSVRHEGPPPARAWPDMNPAAAARLGQCREALAAVAEEHDVPVENLLTPDTVRRLAWEPPEDADPASVAETLRASGARAWQVDLTGPVLADALSAV